MGLRMSSGIKNISAAEFNKILNSTDRSSYQIIDVREKDELAQLALHGDDVINLPLSQNSVWGAQVIRGELLDANKPVLCMCKAGGRSMKALLLDRAVSEAKFPDVTNVLGGITAYAEVDPTVWK